MNIFWLHVYRNRCSLREGEGVIMRVGPVTTMIVMAPFIISPTIFELVYLYGIGIDGARKLFLFGILNNRDCRYRYS